MKSSPAFLPASSNAIDDRWSFSRQQRLCAETSAAISIFARRTSLSNELNLCLVLRNCGIALQHRTGRLRSDPPFTSRRDHSAQLLLNFRDGAVGAADGEWARLS